MTLYLVGIALSLLLHAFFAGSETGMISVSVLKLRHSVEQGRKAAKVAYDLLSRPEYLLSTTLVGTNIALVVCSALSTSLFVKWLGPKLGAALATVAVTGVVLLYCEILPKTLFRQHADRLVAQMALPLHWSQRVLWPVVVVTTAITRRVVALLGKPKEGASPFVTKEEIGMLVEEIGAQGVLEPYEQGLIHGVLDFTLTPVSEVMVPRSQMVWVDQTWTRERIHGLSRTHDLTRLPVFSEEHPVGFVNVFDLFYQESDWRQFIRPIRQVRPSDHIDVVIRDMQAKKQNIALVAEGDRVLGLVTIRNLMEAILSRMHAQKGDGPQDADPSPGHPERP